MLLSSYLLLHEHWAWKLWAFRRISAAFFFFFFKILWNLGGFVKWSRNFGVLRILRIFANLGFGEFRDFLIQPSLSCLRCGFCRQHNKQAPSFIKLHATTIPLLRYSIEGDWMRARASQEREILPNALRRTSDPLWRGGYSLGVDLGLSRTGLALSKGFFPRPLTVNPLALSFSLFTYIHTHSQRRFFI